MKREIKFRVFDPTQKEMIILENSGLQFFDFEGGYSLGFTVDAYSEFWAHEQLKKASEKAKDCITEQFTGLRDKNGNEIYEGDICQLVHIYDKDDKKYIVDFIDGAFCLVNNEEQIIISMYDYDSSEYEVIGNIHQNL